MMYQLRKHIKNEEFDYQILLEHLKNYKYPRDKIKTLLKNGDIIRIKKGIYIFGEKYRQKPFSREVLANMIYGPSYISLEYALYYYGLIPERTETITSITMQYNRIFQTPVGTFVYKKIPKYAYPYGIDWVEIQQNRFVLMADVEKSLLDKVYLDRKIYFRSLRDIEFYLFQDLRIDKQAFLSLNIQKLNLYIEKYKSEKLKYIIKFFNLIEK